jgi:predicted Zn finger-like uncharacterized protein
MDVQCERCKTEYEFDDALVSGRGTTVRCTNCGHQFKVRRADSGASGADQWLVRTVGGQALTFLTLRELQRAILSKSLSRGDVLTHGNAPPRTLGSIAELEPFFEGKTSSRPPPPGASTVPIRVPTPPAVPAMSAVGQGLKRTASWGAPLVDAAPAPRPKVDTLRPVTDGAAPPATQPIPPPAPRTAPAQVAGVAGGQPIVNATPYAFGQAAMAPPGADDPVTIRRPTPTPATPEMGPPTTPLPPPTQPVRRAVPGGDDDPFPMRPWQSSSTDEVYAIPRRRRVGGWVVAAVLVVAVGVVGWVVAKQYISGQTANAGPQLEPRALAFVTEGERALFDGNLDLAQEDLDKASALAEKDPRVLLDEARIAAAKADVVWLRVRLLPADAADDMRATKSQLADRIARVRKAADDAIAVAPDDPAAVRARVDALRLAGESQAARGFVPKIIAQATQPETAYVLAALDLSESEPLWTTVVDRLRLAAAGEGNGGRARAALVYALAKSGDVQEAKSELAKLDAMSRPYPLLPALHAFVDRGAPPGKSSVDGGVAVAAGSRGEGSVAAPPLAAAAGAGTGAAGSSGTEAPGDARGGMQAAGQAIRKGDWGRARQIYEGLVARNPNDSEALSGLGDVSRAQGDPRGAIGAYKRALAVNPSYLPALLGVADTEWASGDRGAAQRAYKDIEDRFPEGTYPPYVKSRTQPIAAAPTAANATSAPPTSASAPPARPAPSVDPDSL